MRPAAELLSKPVRLQTAQKLLKTESCTSSEDGARAERAESVSPPSSQFRSESETEQGFNSNIVLHSQSYRHLAASGPERGLAAPVQFFKPTIVLGSAKPRMHGAPAKQYQAPVQLEHLLEERRSLAFEIKCGLNPHKREETAASLFRLIQLASCH